MSQALRRPAMTRDEFFAFAETRDQRFEFDGSAPVAMVGGLIGHSLIIRNLHRALDVGLRGRSCSFPGPDAGVATVGQAVRYPDAVVTCAPLDLKSRLLTEPVIVFEVISPSSGRIDRIVKLREYWAVPSISRYVIIESAGVGVTVHRRSHAGDSWTTSGLDVGDALDLPEIDVRIPVLVIYEETGLVEAEATDEPAPDLE